MTPELYGVWGGVLPGTWCGVRMVTSAAGEPGCWYAGTLAEAEAAAVVLRRDYPDTEYTVVPFDPEREPAHIDEAPTPAQWALLERIEKLGNIYAYALNGLPSRSVVDAVMARGWCRSIYLPDGREPPWSQKRGEVPMHVLTAAGKRAHAAGAGRG